jgi:hypothetical protein
MSGPLHPEHGQKAQELAARIQGRAAEPNGKPLGECGRLSPR